MNQTFIESAEDDVDGEQCGADQQWLVGEGLLKGLGGTGEFPVNRCREADLGCGFIDRIYGIAKGEPGPQIERQRNRRELTLVIDDQRGGRRFVVSKRAQRDLNTVGSFHVDMLET